MQLPLLTTGDLVVASLAMCLAGVELWMFHSRRAELSHLWAGIVALCTAGYAMLMGLQYLASADSVHLIVRLEFLCLLALATSLVFFASSVTQRALPIPSWVVVVVAGTWAVLIVFTPWVVGPGIRLLELGWLDHPYPRPGAGPLQLPLFLCCLLAGVAAAFFMSRSPTDARRARLFRLGLLAWIAAAAADVALTEGLSFAPAFLLEYGFLAFAGSLVALHLADLREIQVEIHRSRDRIRDEHLAVVAGVGEGILGLDADGRVTVWNPALERIVGVSSEQAVGRPMAALGLASSPELATALREVAAGPMDAEPRVLEISLNGADETRTLLATLTPRRQLDEDRTSVLAVIRDITAERLAKASLQQSEATLRTLIGRLPDLIVVHAEGRILFANEAVADLFGYPSAEALVGTSVFSVLPPEDIEASRDLIAAAEAGDTQGAPKSQRIKTLDGEIIEVEIAVMATVYEGRQAVLVLGRDTREERRRQAREAEDDRLRSVGTLAAGVAHEINNPLTYVLGNIDLSLDLLGPAPGEETPPPLSETDRGELREMLAEVRAGAARVQEIVKDLNSMSRSAPGQRQLDIDNLLRTAVAMTRHVVRHRAQVVLDLGPAPMVRANDARLGQVFINLLVNAAQALPDGGAADNRIEVRTYTADGHAVVEVRDTGSGIPPEVRKRIFDPFFTTKPVGHGTGLGLSICRDTVLALGGTIEVESEVGKGSVFRVRLPPAAASQSSRPPIEAIRPRGPSSRPPGGRPKVLVVDDEETIGKLLKRSLTAYEVAIAGSGRQAREMLSNGETFDLVLCDLMMPELSGMDLFRSVEAEWPDLAPRFVFMTGGAFSPEAEEFIRAMGGPDLRKPFSPEEVQRLVAERLAG